MAALLITTSSQSQAGAWVPEKGKGYTKLGYSYFNADDFFGTNDEFDEFTGQNYSYYAEYGLGNKLGVYGSVLYQDLEQTDSNGNQTNASGLGDVEIGLRYQWQANPFVFSTSVLAKLPYLYDEDDELPRGNGQEDIEIRFLIGKSLNRYGYFGIEAGYRFRTQEPSDEFRYLLEYGFNVNDNLYLRTKLDGIANAGNADTVTQDDGLGNLAITPEFDLGKLELTAGWNFGPAGKQERWGLEFTYTKDLYGDQTLDGDTFQLGLTYVY